MANSFDTIIIGAGVNGLTAGAYLAKAGQRVLVLERRAMIGGTAVTEELGAALQSGRGGTLEKQELAGVQSARGAMTAGFQCDTLVSNLTGLNPRIARELGLQGVEFIDAEPSVHALTVDGAGVTLWRDAKKTAEGLRQFSTRDAEKWGAFVERVAKVTNFLEAVYAATPPRPNEIQAESLWTLGTLGLKLRGLGKTDLYEGLRMLPIPIADWLDEWFENDTLKGALAAGGITALMQGPFATGTTLNFLHRQVFGGGVIRPTRYVRGGIGKLADALATVIKARGGEIRTDAAVTQIVVKNERATGVVLRSGEERTAARIVSSADPYTTFLELVGTAELDAEFVKAVRNIKFRGAAAKMNLALDALPAFKNTDASLLCGTICINPTIESLERAYDDAKYGGYSQKPYLEVTIPTLADPGRAPAGKHVMSVWMQYAPFRLEEWGDRNHRDWRVEKEKLGDLVIKTLEEYAPNLESLITHSQILTPCDLQETYGLREGSLTQGAIMLDQFFFMRPVPGWAQYRTPIASLYLCGGGTHPGGGVAGASGRNAAREILRSK